MTEQTKKYEERLKLYAGELERNLSTTKGNLAETNKQVEDLEKRTSGNSNALYHLGQHRVLLESVAERYRTEAERFYKYFPELRPNS